MIIYFTLFYHFIKIFKNVLGYEEFLPYNYLCMSCYYGNDNTLE